MGLACVPVRAISPASPQYVGSGDRRVYALSLFSGDLLWSFATGGVVYCSPAISPEGVVYVGSYDNSVYALHGDSGSLLWKYTTGGSVFSSPTIDPVSGAVYVGSADYSLYALDGDTGHLLWHFATNGPVYGSPCLSQSGVLLIGSNDNRYFRAADKHLQSVTRPRPPG